MELLRDPGTAKTLMNTADQPIPVPAGLDPKDPIVHDIEEYNRKRTFLGDYPMHLLVGRNPKYNTPELLNLVNVFFLNEHPVEAACRNVLGSTPLHRAVAAGNLPMAEALISKTGTPVSIAVLHRQRSSVQLTCVERALRRALRFYHFQRSEHSSIHNKENQWRCVHIFF